MLEDQWCAGLCAGRSVLCETVCWKISGVQDYSATTRPTPLLRSIAGVQSLRFCCENVPIENHGR